MSDGERMIVDLLTHINKQLEQITRSERPGEKEQRPIETMPQLDLAQPILREWS